MTVDRDPELLALFKSNEREFSDDAFTARVMSSVEKRRRRTIIGWAAAGLVLVVFAWVLVLILQDAIFLLADILPPTLVSLENTWAATLLAPLNSIRGLFGLGALMLLLAFRRLFF